MFLLIFGAVLGFTGCLYWMTFLQNKYKKKSGNEVEGKTIYLNFNIVDKSEAVKRGVEDKLGGKFGTGFLAQKVAAGVGNLAARTISDESVGEKMSSKMIEMIPEKMGEMGLVASAKRVFGQDSYFVIKLTIVSANIQKLLNKAVGEQKASKVDEMLGVLGGQWAKNTAAESILPMIASKIQEKLPEKMSEQFEQKGLKCTIIVKPESEQADYFYTVIGSLD